MPERKEAMDLLSRLETFEGVSIPIGLYHYNCYQYDYDYDHGYD